MLSLLLAKIRFRRSSMTSLAGLLVVTCAGWLSTLLADFAKLAVTVFSPSLSGCWDSLGVLALMAA